MTRHLITTVGDVSATVADIDAQRKALEAERNALQADLAVLPVRRRKRFAAEGAA